MRLNCTAGHRVNEYQVTAPRHVRLDLDPRGYADPAETLFHASTLKSARATIIIVFVLRECKVKKLKCKKILSLEVIFIFAHYDNEIFENAWRAILSIRVATSKLPATAYEQFTHNRERGEVFCPIEESPG